MMIAFAQGVVLIALAFLLWKRDISSIKIFFWPALLIKLLCGVMLGWIYIHYYHLGDTISYFKDASALADVARGNLGLYFDFLLNGDESFQVWSRLVYQQPRALFLSKVASIFCLISHNNYWIVSLYFSFISFMATWYLSTYLAMFDSKVKAVAVVSLLFFPSVVFWTSGLVKESLATAALYFLVVVFLKIFRGERVRIMEWLAVPLAVWFLWNLKYYYLALFLPVVCTALVMKLLVYPNVTFRYVTLEWLMWLAIFSIPLVAASQLHPNFYPERFLNVIVDNYHQFERLSDQRDMVVFNDLEPTAGSVITHAPLALMSALFRPFLWEVQNPLQLLVAVENSILLLLTLIAMPNLRKLVHSQNRLILFSLMVYVVLLAIFLALSTPNYGTLVRYRVGFLPFFVMLILLNNPLFLKAMSFVESIFPALVRKNR